ncbi:MAG: EamA family transporter [Victivallales bacterium]|jgi:drug/metabolite transporter (DMT)-like permease
MGMVYAICSLGFAGVNDVVFRRYGQKPRPVGFLLAFIGVVWASFFFALGLLKNNIEVNVETLLIGSVAGIMSALANILLVEGMKKTGASIAATIYRLNIVFVVLLAFLFLHESINLLKISALSMAIIAILLFSMPRWNGKSNEFALKFILILLLASFLRACMGISYKVASSCGANDEMFLAVNGIWWIIAGCIYTLARERGIKTSRSTIKYGLWSGILICGIVMFLKLAVNCMDASVAISISQFSFLVTAPLAAFIMNERISLKMGLGMSLAALCIILFAVAK